MSDADKFKFPEEHHHSWTAGAMPMDTEGPAYSEKYRLDYGMTDEDRQYRRQWLQDQVLAETEPVNVPGLYQARTNPIRRFLCWPMNQVVKAATPYVGFEKAQTARFVWRGFCFGMVGLWASIYYFKYNAHNWESPSGWTVYARKPVLLPGDPGYSEHRAFPDNHWADFGFSAAPEGVRARRVEEGRPMPIVNPLDWQPCATPRPLDDTEY